MQVFVLDAEKKPLKPCHPAVARKLLAAGKAAVWKRHPFTIILKAAKPAVPEHLGLRIKVDPGSKTSGIALVDNHRILWAAELEHRGHSIKKKLYDRGELRKKRRYRKTRYRQKRWRNRRVEPCAGCGKNARKNRRYCRPCAEARNYGNNGYRVVRLAPSLESRVHNIVTWVRRLRTLAPISAISMELVRFDMQKMEKPEISGVEYQQGTLTGYDAREYLLEKFDRQCAYCEIRDVPLEVEHVHPQSRGGSNRVSNLAISCNPCNVAKGNKTLDEWAEELRGKRTTWAKTVLKNIPNVKKQVKTPLKDAAAVNAVRWRLYDLLAGVGLPVETGSGSRTKYNRRRLELYKAHWTDAACVGASTPGKLELPSRVMSIKATGHGRRQRCSTDKYGFPKQHAARAKRYMGYRTGDLVRTLDGQRCGRVTIRHRPSFTLCSKHVHPRNLVMVQQADGYEYGWAV